MNEKRQSLIEAVDLTRPDLVGVGATPDPAAALVRHLAAPPRPRFRFEYERKSEILAFLRAHDEGWRNFDTAPAERVAALTIEQAQGARALSGVAELGKAWWATGDPSWGAAFERFYLAVPTGGMFNWSSFNGAQGALELSAWFLLLDCPGFTLDGRVAFLDHLRAIAADAWANTSSWDQLGLGPEGHNWYLHGAQVLPAFGLLFPEFKQASFFLRAGAGFFEEHVRGHYKADGGARETTLGYQHSSLPGLWDFYLLAQRNGYPLSPGFADRLLAATLFLLKLMSPDGGLPSFGDTQPGPGTLTRLAATAAALTGDGACKWFAERIRGFRPGASRETPGQLPSDAFWAVGLAGAATYAETRVRDPNLSSVLMGPTGYAAMRNSDKPDAAYLAVAAADRGPIVTSHGHNEVFSLDVHALGTRFLGELGCAPYGESPARDYDQMTQAHNCLALEGMEQAPLAGEWRWRGHVIPAVRRWMSEPTHDFFHGVHEGYYRWPEHRTLHARKIVFLKQPPCYWVVLDWLLSDVENRAAAYFHACVEGRIQGDSIRLGAENRPNLAIIPPAETGLVPEPVAHPGLEAYRASKHVAERDYPCFAFRKQVASDCLAWVLVPLAPGRTPPRVARLSLKLNGQPAEPHQALALQVAFPDQVDTLLVSHTEFDAELHAGDLVVWGIAGFQRAAPDGTLLGSWRHTVRDGCCGR